MNGMLRCEANLDCLGKSVLFSAVSGLPLKAAQLIGTFSHVHKILVSGETGRQKYLLVNSYAAHPRFHLKVSRHSSTLIHNTGQYFHRHLISYLGLEL